MRFLAILLIGTGVSAARAAEPTKEGAAFFETHIRPVLAERCYSCHSKQAKSVKGELLLDTKAGLAKGSENGPIIVSGDVEKSRLIQVLRWTEPESAMPPKEKLPAAQIEKFEQWVKMGAPDPRTDTAPAAAPKALGLEAGRKWWAFQPVSELPVPAVREVTWPQRKIDAFVLQKLEAGGLKPSPAADPRTLLQRITLDLTGLRPTYEQSEAFARDPSEKAYRETVDRLLASPAYGQRWGRYWLDVARYGEDNPTTEATNPPYPFAWRYRDWVIDAVNSDLPYDRFVKLQLAADLMPDAPRGALAATGFLGCGPTYHKDGRLSKEVIENLYHDDWDERVDTVSRGLLGLTVACARCHDHKFDPISTRDYYALAGVFASTVAVTRPLAEVPPEAEARFMLAAQRLFYTSYAANLLRDDPGSKPREARRNVEKWVAELDTIEAEIAALREKYPALHAYLARLDRRPKSYEFKLGEVLPDRKRSRGNPEEPLVHSVLDAGLWVNGSDPDFTMPDIRPGTPHDLNVLPGGNVAKPRELVPRGFPTVLAKGEASFHQGSGRLELAEKIFTDSAPLTARVIVNRVWGWHFGKPLVDTPSDFGTQGERPTHPELLDDLSARFIASGWSLKWLHREIALSATYRQASRPRPEGIAADPANRLLWRMNPRRLDIEAYRDCLLQAAAGLDYTAGGPSSELEQPGNRRRTVYARISRGRLNGLLQLFGFPEATMHSPNRETTTSPLQQLYAMNSPFMRGQAEALLGAVAEEFGPAAKVRAMYQRALARDPSSRELELADRYLKIGTLKDYAHALLATNEVIYWP